MQPKAPEVTTTHPAATQTIQRSKGFWGGLFGGAALGVAFGGPAGMLGGAIGGAVLGPVFEWWHNLPTHAPLPFTAHDLSTGRQNLRHTAPVPRNFQVNTADLINPDNLAVGRQNLQHTGPVPRTFQVNTADLINPGNLAVGRHNLRHTGPVPRNFQVNTADLINPGNLAVGRQNLRNTPVPVLPTPNIEGWHLTLPDPVVVDLSLQTKGKRLDQLILLPQGVRFGRVLFRNSSDQNLLGNLILGAGAWRIRYCYQMATGQTSAPKEEILHIKPTIDEVMIQMGFVDHGWWWGLAYGTHGVLRKDFHVTVPKALQSMPERMDDLKAIREGLFPAGEDFDGTHMSIECAMQLNRGYLNNAAYFRNGTSKYPKGYRLDEQKEFVSACQRRFNKWWKEESLPLLRAALQQL